MQIFVSTPSGKTITLKVEPTNIIKDVKAQIEEKERLEVEYQRLVYTTKQCEDGQVLSDLGIKEGSTLFLVMRLPGGMQM